MRIAAWNIPPVDFLLAGFATGSPPVVFDVVRVHDAACERLLHDQTVDVALLPTLTVLQNVEDLDVLPGAGLSSSEYPFARLVVDHGLDEGIRRVAFDASRRQERFLVEVILREHYHMEPSFLELPDASIDDLLQADADAHLLVGSGVPSLRVDRLAIDLGRDWYELVHYPMVWGLLAARKGRATPEMIRSVRRAVHASEEQRDIWMRAYETSDALHRFYGEHLRLVLDDVAVAGMTEFIRHAFYYDLVDEVREIPFVSMPSAEEEGGWKS